MDTFLKMRFIITLVYLRILIRRELLNLPLNMHKSLQVLSRKSRALHHCLVFQCKAIRFVIRIFAVNDVIATQPDVNTSNGAIFVLGTSTKMLRILAKTANFVLTVGTVGVTVADSILVKVLSATAIFLVRAVVGTIDKTIATFTDRITTKTL